MLLKTNKHDKAAQPITKWQVLLGILKVQGWTQTDIGLVCGVSQAAINQINIGNTKEPRHELGENLLSLLKNTNSQPQ